MSTDQQTLIKIQKEIPTTHYFVYKNNKYPFQIDFFKYSSIYFFQNQKTLEQNKFIPLVDKECEDSLNFSESSIISFIKYVQREEIPLNDDNVFALNYLGVRYEIDTLIESTTDYIQKHQNGLILQILTNSQLDSKFDKKLYEDILSANLVNYISDDRLLSLKFPIIYRVVEKTPNKSDPKIIDFCFKCLDKFGGEASPLFALIDMGDMLSEKINLLMTKYSNIFDFHFINSSLLKSVYESQNEIFLREKKNNEEQENLLLLMTKIKEDHSKMINEFKDEIQKIKGENEKKQVEIDFLKEEINKLKNENKIIEKLNQMQNEHQNEMNQMKDEMSSIKLQLEQKSNIEMFENVKCDVTKLSDEMQTLREIQSKLKEEKCFLRFCNYKDVEKFNQMNGDMQIYISFINQFISFKKNQAIFSKITEFLLYLSSEVMKSKKKQNSKFNYIFIHNNETENIDFSSIGIGWKLLDLLFENKSFNSSEFQSHISNFSTFYFEIGYPSQFFDYIYYDILEMKKSNIKISIFIHNINETDFKFTYNKDIHDIQFDSSVNIIKGVNNIGHDGSFFSCKSITKIIIPSSMTSIGEYAFSYCTSLTQVSFVTPSNVTKIGDNAFDGCSSLTQISFPSSVAEIGENAFRSCSSLTQVSIPSSVSSFKGYIFSWCSKLNKIIIIPCAEKRVDFIEDKFLIFKKDAKNDIYDTLIWVNPNINSVTIPSFIKILSDGSFAGCRSITQITISSSVTSIEKGVFHGCSGIKEIFFEAPSSVVSIGDSAFYDCTSLTQITIPSSVTSICDSAFYDCSSLTQITIPSSVIKIGQNIFICCSKLSQISFEVPSSLTSIGECAFDRCNSLTQVSIPSSVASIGSNPFNDCDQLNKIIIIPCNEKRIELFEDKFLILKTNDANGTILWAKRNMNTVTIPSFVRIIGDNIFYKNYSLTKVSIPSSVVSIGNSAFYFCDRLEQITMPSSLISIGNYAFYQCSKLMQITFPSTIISIGDYAFYDCYGLKQISIPSSIASLGNNVFRGCINLNKIEILTCTEKRIEYIDDKFLVCKTDVKSSIYDILLWANLKLSSAVVPSFIKIIGDNSFIHNKLLTQITIPSSVTSIGKEVFSYCPKLTQISFESPSSVVSIGDSAFSDCASLTHISIPSSVTSIGKGVLNCCRQLIQISFEAPSSVVSIGDSAFSDCVSLTQISIPSSVTSIGNYAFSRCEKLTQLSIPSSINRSNLSIPENTNITII